MPIYYARVGQRTVISTRLKWMCSFGGAQRRLDPFTAAMWVSAMAVFPDGRSLVEGVSVLPRGHTLSVSRGSLHQTRYWRPESERLTRDADAAGVRRDLMGQLRAELSDDRPNPLTLSGGVDFSTLAAFARSLDKPVASMSLVPPLDQPAQRRRERTSRPWSTRLASTPTGISHSRALTGSDTQSPEWGGRRSS